MTRDELKFRAALSRFAVGLIALVLLPTFYPASRSHLWIWIAYLAVAVVEQVLIRKHIGGSARAVVSGLVDIAVLTYTVHGLGSVVTPMTSLYLFAGVANALVVNVRVAWLLSVAGPLAFNVVVWLEYAGFIPFAPDAPEVAALGHLPLAQTLMASVFISVFVPASTAIVATLVRAVNRRESDLVFANKRLEELSQLDPLTGLFNRRHLFARLEAELARLRRGHPLAIIMVDLDHFKQVNDSQGHLRGDVLLREIASALAKTTRVTDVAGRYGGDEFVVVLPDTDANAALAAAERVAEAVRVAAQVFDEGKPVTASVGIGLAEPSDTVASLLRRADENAYRAKESGGNRVAS
jgi:diguanylate cyclase (GGDEF)-like protein